MNSSAFKTNWYVVFPNETDTIWLRPFYSAQLGTTTKFMTDPICILVKRDELTLKDIKQFQHIGPVKVALAWQVPLRHLSFLQAWNNISIQNKHAQPVMPLPKSTIASLHMWCRADLYLPQGNIAIFKVIPVIYKHTFIYNWFLLRLVWCPMITVSTRWGI